MSRSVVVELKKQVEGNLEGKGRVFGRKFGRNFEQEYKGSSLASQVLLLLPVEFAVLKHDLTV